MTRILAQKLWAPSVIQVGDRITGRCVTNNTEYTGTVAEVVGPIASPDCGGYRYRLTNTGRNFWDGRPITPIVFADGFAE